MHSAARRGAARTRRTRPRRWTRRARAWARLDSSTMSAQNFETHVTPQRDGALAVELPDEGTLYDMGNRQLFITLDGCGGAPRVLLTEGYYAGAWQLEGQLDTVPFVFARARGIGRLWELTGAQAGVEIQLDSYLDETSAAVFQQCTANNPTSQPHRLDLALTLDIRPPFTTQEQQQSADALARAQQPGAAHLWGQGLAKLALPSVPDRLYVHSGGRVELAGETPFIWGATKPPRVASADNTSVRLHWNFELAAGAQAQVAWVLHAGGWQELEDALARRERVLEQASAYADWLSTRLQTGDPLLQSLFVAGLNCAVAMFKEFPQDDAGLAWAGLVAGPDYAYPPRLYFRDSYWTAQVL